MRQTRVAAAFVLLALLHSSETAAQRPLPQALADPQVARALAAVDARRDQTARWLATIGGIVSPSGQERERAEAVATAMRRIGLADVTVDAAPNVVGRIRGRSGKALVFVSTLDDLATVAAHQRATTAKPRIEGDRVIGPGTNTSTTTAARVAAADALVTSGVQPEHDLVFVAVAQEETGLVGMKALDEQWKDRALAFVDVLGDGHSVTYGAITIHWWKVVASGPGGHSLNGGVPNVNQGIGRAVDRILQLPQPEQYQADRVVVNMATDASQVRSPMSTARTRTLVLATLVVALTASSRAQEQAPTWPREAEAPSTPRPPAPPAEVFGLVGEYESAAAGGAKPVHLYVIERDGRVMTIVDRGTPVAVDAAVPKPVFTRDARGRAATVTVGKVAYSRLLVGPEAGGQLRVTPVRSVPDVLKASQTLAPPAEAGDFLPSDLVELTTLEPGIKLDVRYATTNNFLGSVFYAEARAFLQRPAAAAVVRVHRTLAALGYGLLVHDGYRPWYVTKTFWETTPADRKWLVASPNPGSRHNRGAAVDLTLYDLKTGAVVEMPSTYDESTPRAYAFYPGGTSLQRWHRALLRRVMEAEGFAVNPEEWWHFDYQDWRRYAVGNVAFDKIPVPRMPGARNAHRRVAPARVLTAVPAAG